MNRSALKGGASLEGVRDRRWDRPIHIGDNAKIGSNAVVVPSAYLETVIVRR